MSLPFSDLQILSFCVSGFYRTMASFPFGVFYSFLSLMGLCMDAAKTSKKRRSPRKEVVYDDIPLGYRFLPTDEELISDFLVNKIRSREIPYQVQRIMHEAQVFNSHPADLAADYEPATENAWYFLIPRDGKCYERKGLNDEGYWLENGDHMIPICNCKGLIVGFKKTRHFYGGQCILCETSWVMEEYWATEDYENGSKTASESVKLDDWVLFRIFEDKESLEDFRIFLK